MAKVFKFDLPCSFGGTVSMVSFYIGDPESSHNPIGHQANWLSKERGGSVPPQVMDALQEAQQIAKKNGVPLTQMMNVVMERVNIAAGNAGLLEQADTAQNVDQNSGIKVQTTKVMSGNASGAPK